MHTVKVCSGPDESTYYTDRCISENWQWNGTPNLKVEDIWSTSTIAGDSFTVNAKVSNIGNEDAREADSGKVDYIISITGVDNDYSWSAPWHLPSIPAWPDDPSICSFDGAVTGTGRFTDGTYTLELRVDPYGLISDSAGLYC